MATLSHASILMALCLSFFFLFPSPTEAATPAELVKDLCGRTTIYTFCAHALQSDPRTASAKKALTIARIAIEAGVANANDTKAFIQNIHDNKDTKPEIKKTIESCASEYDNVIASMKSALGELEEDTMTANYDAMVIGDSVSLCETTMADDGVHVESILLKNNVTRQFAQMAVAATELLGG